MAEKLLGHLVQEFLLLWRYPAFTVPSIAYPLLLFLFFGLTVDEDRKITTLVSLSFCAFALLGVVLFDFGIGFASRRGSPWETYLRTLPVAPWVPMIARLVVAVPFGVLAMAPVALTATLTGRLQLGAVQWLAAIGALFLGMVPFACLGVLLGYVCSSRSAGPVTTLIYLPLAYVGGIFQRPESLPHVVATLSTWTPTRMWRNLLENVVFATVPATSDLAGLVLYAVALGALAVVAVRRSELRSYA